MIPHTPEDESLPEPHTMKTDDGYHWHVLGAGAIGLLFAAYLQRAGGTITLLDHSGSGEQLRTASLSGLEPTGEWAFPVSDIAEAGAIERVLVTTKAYNAEAALRSVQHRLSASSSVVLMVNGMGIADALTSSLNNAALYLATTTEGAHRQGSNTVVHAGTGLTQIGSANGSPPPTWFSMFERALPACHWEQDMAACLWRKLAINAAINPLTAVLRCKNGELAGDPADQVRALCSEIQIVAEAAGMGRATAELASVVFAVIQGTAENRSSMLQDIEARRRTEVDYINGWLVQEAEKFGVPVPHNRALWEAVKSLDG